MHTCTRGNDWLERWSEGGMIQSEGTLLLSKAEIVGAAQPGQEGIPGRSYYSLSVLKEG